MEHMNDPSFSVTRSGVITACTRLKGLNTASKKFELLIGDEGLSLNNIVKQPYSGKELYVPIKKVVGSQIVKYDPKSKTLRKSTAFLGEDSKRFAGMSRHHRAAAP